MPEVVKVRIGAQVRCSDGPVGRLSRMLVDLESNEVTDLDVAVRRGPGRMVPISLVTAGGHEVELQLTTANFSELPVNFVVGVNPNSVAALGMRRPGDAPLTSSFNSLPFGRRFRGRVTPPKEPYLPSGVTELRIDTSVRATDGHAGDFNGLVVAEGGRTPTHVLMLAGHRSARRELAVPIAEVRSLLGRGIELSITRAQLLAPTIGTI
jgi:hypothetical protein